MARRVDLGHRSPGLGIDPLVLEDHPPVEADEVVDLGEPDVDDGEAVRREMVGEDADRRALPLPRGEQEQRVEGDERERVRARIGQAQIEQVALDQVDPAGSVRHLRDATRRPLEHRRVEVDDGDVVTVLRERDREPAGPAPELEDRAAGPSARAT